MSIRPWIVVEAPDRRGLRRVTVGGETVGSAWSPGELRKTLGRLGYPEDIDFEDATALCWRGGDSGTWPDRAGRRRATLAFMTAGLLASMALSAAIGWPDAFGALTFAQRVSGFLFVLAGAVQGAAALMAVDYWGRRQYRVSGAVVLMGVLIALATDSLLLFLWLEEKEYTHYTLAFMPLWCWAVWALGVLVREKAWQGVPRPRTFAAGVVATALLTGVSLTYSTVYQPAAAPEHFTLDVQFGKSREDRVVQFIHVPMTLRMKNTGGIPVYIINDDYTVRGRASRYSQNPSFRHLVREWSESEQNERGEAELHVDDLVYTTISSGHFYGPGNRLESGQEYTLTRVFQLPRDAAYDIVSVGVRIFYMRKDRGKLDAEEFGIPHRSWDDRVERFYCPPEQGCDRHLIHHARVLHNNNLINVTRKPRYVTALWSPGRRFTSSISSYHYTGRSSFLREEQRELGRYGTAEVRVHTEVPLTEFLISSGVRRPSG